MFVNKLRVPTKIICARKRQLPGEAVPSSIPCCRQFGLYPTGTVSKLMTHLEGNRINLQERYIMWKLRYLLGPAFSKEEFLKGTCQATAALLEAVRRVDWKRIRDFCTEEFSLAMYRIALKECVHADLMRLQAEDMKISLALHFKRKKYDNGRSFVYVDLGMVGRRLLPIQPNCVEVLEISGMLLKVPAHQKILLAAYEISFRKELSGPDGEDPEDEAWLVNSFKVQDMALMGVSRKDHECWFFRALKPY